MATYFFREKKAIDNFMSFERNVYLRNTASLESFCFDFFTRYGIWASELCCFWLPKQRKKVKVKSAYGPMWPTRLSLSRFPLHKATRSISTPPWMRCQSIAGLPPSIKFAGTHLYTWVERGTVGVKCHAKNTTQCPRPGLEPGPLAPESSALSMGPPRLPQAAEKG